MAYIGNQVSSLTTAAQVTNTTTNTEDKSAFLTFVDAQGGTGSIQTDNSLTYNPNTNLLSTAGNVTASHVSVTNSVQATTVNAPTHTGTTGTFSGNVTASHVSVTNSVQATTVNATTHTGSTGTFSGNVTAAYFSGTATQALYADLAENYEADDNYAPGTVLIFGGEAEVTIATKSHDTRVAGIVSTNPAYLMNKENGNTTIGLTGRVPCQVKGPVDKGTLLVTSETPGVAQALNDAYYKPGCIIGKSMGKIDNSSVAVIEVAVGRF